ncbi:MAG TPA: NADH-quinone oxidoreductase subunit N [Opitutaceae bacterium]|nr:NADH-quinone oxidoreductase subunit N [Opitutaceae bacterium]
MNPDLVKAFSLAAEQNRWAAILPEVVLGCLALMLLVLEIVLPKRDQKIIPIFAIFGQIVVLAGMIFTYRSDFIGDDSLFGGMVRQTAESQFMRIFFVIASILVSILGVIALAKQRMPKIEFFHIVIVVTGAMMLLVQSNHFVLFFVALETLTVGLYILVSYVRTNPLSLEAGLKYLISGALSSAILLFGIVLLYGVAGKSQIDSMNFGQLHTFLAANPGNFLASVGVAFVLCGVAFKVGAVPFQIWIPDVYQGASTPITALLAVSSKAAGVSVLLLLARTVFEPYSGFVIPLLSVLTAATIIFGNVAALGQQNVKRLIGLSGVSHAGYLMLGVIASFTQPQAINAIHFYLFVYLLASFAVFGVMVHVAGVDDADQQLDHYGDLARERPFLGGVLAIGLGSLAGIPPLAGFIGKLLVFVAVYKAGLNALLFIAIAGVVVSIYYYFGWIKAAFFPVWQVPVTEGEPETRPARTPVAAPMGVLLGAIALASIVLGFYQAPITAWLAALH